MTRWHHLRRIVSALLAALVAGMTERRGLPMGTAVLLGIACAIIFASLIFPLLWRPPRVGPPAG